MLVALIQTQIVDFEIEKNLNNFTNLCKTIANSIDWIVLPEMFLTGFVTDVSLCKESETKGLNFMRNLAKEKSCAVEGSLLIEENGLYYNRHYFITPDKEYFYDKQKLFSLSDEAKVLTNGTKSVIAEFKSWKINLKTCYDLRFCDICKNGFSDNSFNYDILSFVASWPKSRNQQWLTLLQSRAIENQCFVIGVNRCGVDSSNTEYSGDSCLINMKGQIVEPLNYSADNIFYYDIDKKNLDKGREKFPVYLDW